MFRFLLRPRWILLTALVLALVAGMVDLGFWQLRRLDERKDRNELIAERRAARPATLESVLTAADGDAEAAAAEWRSVTATGRYDDRATVIVRNRSYQGSPGYHAVTPLVLDDGSAVLVNRGFISVVRDPSLEPTAPPAPEGEVTVTGRVRRSQTSGIKASRIDVEAVEADLGRPLVPAYLELQSTSPEPPDPQPALLPALTLSDGPHLSYALQWFAFSGLAVVGWVLVVRREARISATGSGPAHAAPQPPRVAEPDAAPELGAAGQGCPASYDAGGGDRGDGKER